MPYISCDLGVLCLCVEALYYSLPSVSCGRKDLTRQTLVRISSIQSGGSMPCLRAPLAAYFSLVPFLLCLDCCVCLAFASFLHCSFLLHTHFCGLQEAGKEAGTGDIELNVGITLAQGQQHDVAASNSLLLTRHMCWPASTAEACPFAPCTLPTPHTPHFPHPHTHTHTFPLPLCLYFLPGTGGQGQPTLPIPSLLLPLKHLSLSPSLCFWGLWGRQGHEFCCMALWNRDRQEQARTWAWAPL